jgi:hypothetical protein
MAFALDDLSVIDHEASVQISDTSGSHNDIENKASS